MKWPARHPRWYLYLGTWIILGIFAAYFFYKNYFEENVQSGWTFYTPYSTTTSFSQGWPWPYRQPMSSDIDSSALRLDVAVAIGILLAVGSASELFWHWKSRQPELHFKLHLSTLIVLSLAAALFLGCNVIPFEAKGTVWAEFVVSKPFVALGEEDGSQSTAQRTWAPLTLGWPCIVRVREISNLYDVNDLSDVRWFGIAKNLQVLGVALWLLAYLLELRILRTKQGSN